MRTLCYAFWWYLSLLAVSVAVASPTPDASLSSGVQGVNHEVFASQAQPDIKLRFVKDSGVCETTPGVHQLSGYIETGPNMSTVRILVYEKNKNVA